MHTHTHTSSSISASHVLYVFHMYWHHVLYCAYNYISGGSCQLSCLTRSFFVGLLAWEQYGRGMASYTPRVDSVRSIVSPPSPCPALFCIVYHLNSLRVTGLYIYKYICYVVGSLRDGPIYRSIMQSVVYMTGLYIDLLRGR